MTNQAITHQAISNRANTWIDRLGNDGNDGTAVTGFVPSVKVVDSTVADKKVRYIGVIPDADNAFVRAQNGEVGLLEGWNLAKAVMQVVEQEQNSDNKTPIVAVIDVPSQAYGRREEAYGIHQALAAAANAYAKARLAGHSVIGLIVGKAMSGGFLAHGYQANRLLALDDSGCMVHAMGKEAAARVTLRSVAELEKLAASIPPMAYDIDNYAALGLLWKKVAVNNADNPNADDVANIKQLIAEAIADIEQDGNNDLSQRLNNQGNNGEHLRQASVAIRKQMAAEW